VGQAVSFAGSGSDTDGSISSYSWSFPGGSPASSAIANAGNVTYSSAGTYTASLTVTDNGGATSTPATRTITVIADFGISATPSSLTVKKGSSGSYTATITALQGFTGTVTLSVNGLPKFATPNFTPASVVNSGNSVLSVTTNKNVTAGTYPLTITGTSGNRVHSVGVTLIIQ
jgi:PKD repeat protein